MQVDPQELQKLVSGVEPLALYAANFLIQQGWNKELVKSVAQSDLSLPTEPGEPKFVLYWGPEGGTFGFQLLQQALRHYFGVTLGGNPKASKQFLGEAAQAIMLWHLDCVTGQNGGIDDEPGPDPRCHGFDCPDCSNETNVCIRNIGRNHWRFCDTCKSTYLYGSNLFSGWREETAADWIRSVIHLERYKPIGAKPPTLEEYLDFLKASAPPSRKAAVSVATSGDEDVLF